MSLKSNLLLIAGKKTYVGDDPLYRKLTMRERFMVFLGLFVYGLPLDLGYRLFPGMYGEQTSEDPS